MSERGGDESNAEPETETEPETESERQAPNGPKANPKPGRKRAVRPPTTPHPKIGGRIMTDRMAATADNSMLFDMHCHLDFVENSSEFRELADVCGIASLSNTVTPEDFARLAPAFAGSPFASLALGAHPWWIADGRVGKSSLELFEHLAAETPFIGEVGLDFKGDRERTREIQITALKRILTAAGPGKLVSLHGSGAERELLDLLEDTGTAKSCDCILHWYAGPADQLRRAVELGCCFSVGRRMLKTRRGREYARIIPVERLLLETDMPSREHTRYTPGQWNADLTEALLTVAKARETSPDELLEVIGSTSKRLLTAKRTSRNPLPDTPSSLSPPPRGGISAADAEAPMSPEAAGLD